MDDKNVENAESCNQDEKAIEEEEASNSTSNSTIEAAPVEDLLSKFRLTVQGLGGEEKERPEQLLDEVTFEGVARFIKNEKCKNIVVMTGAGISTSAGIPDFRTPGTGLYDNLQKYNLPTPQSVFEIQYFKSNPEPFYKLAKEIYPGLFKPTIGHYFIKLLEKKGILLRNYTQNIDTLERRAGISGDKIIEAHGTFHTAHCIECRKEYSQQFIKDEIFQDRIPQCSECDGGLIKPDIVFFGESLPSRFKMNVGSDMSACDLLIVIGTSLVVQPFASLIDRVPQTTPRLLINREKAGEGGGNWMSFLFGGGGFRFDEEDNFRDVAWLGNADDGCLALADLLGWKEELTSLVAKSHKDLDKTEIIIQHPTKETKPAGMKDEISGNKTPTASSGKEKSLLKLKSKTPDSKTKDDSKSKTPQTTSKSKPAGLKDKLSGNKTPTASSGKDKSCHKLKSKTPESKPKDVSKSKTPQTTSKSKPAGLKDKLSGNKTPTASSGNDKSCHQLKSKTPESKPKDVSKSKTPQTTSKSPKNHSSQKPPKKTPNSNPLPMSSCKEKKEEVHELSQENMEDLRDSLAKTSLNEDNATSADNSKI